MVDDLVVWLNKLKHGEDLYALATTAGILHAVRGLTQVCRHLVETMEPRIICDIPGKQSKERLVMAYRDAWEKLEAAANKATVPTPVQIAGCPPVY